MSPFVDSVVDERLPGWFWLDGALIRHAARIGVFGVCVYTVLAYGSFGERWSPSVSTLAEVLGISEDSVRAGIQALLDIRAICLQPDGQPMLTDISEWKA